MSGPPNTRFSVAAHALVYVAGMGVGRAVSSEELAGSVEMSPVFVRRVLGPLRVAGLVCSRPGTGGGWQLARPAAEITLDMVWDSVPNGDVLPRHLPRSTCPVRRHVQDMLSSLERGVALAVRAELRGTTVADLVSALGAHASTARASPRLGTVSEPTAMGGASKV